MHAPLYNQSLHSSRQHVRCDVVRSSLRSSVFTTTRHGRFYKSRNMNFATLMFNRNHNALWAIFPLNEYFRSLRLRHIYYREAQYERYNTQNISIFMDYKNHKILLWMHFIKSLLLIKLNLLSDMIKICF